MSKEFSEGNSPQAADLAALDPHYEMSAATKGEMDNLFNAVGVVGLMAEAADGGRGPVVTLSDMATLHQAFASLGKRLMGEIPARFPNARGASQA